MYTSGVEHIFLETLVEWLHINDCNERPLLGGGGSQLKLSIEARPDNGGLSGRSDFVLAKMHFSSEDLCHQK